MRREICNSRLRRRKALSSLTSGMNADENNLGKLLLGDVDLTPLPLWPVLLLLRYQEGVGPMTVHHADGAGHETAAVHAL